MVEVIGDVVIPAELIVPDRMNTAIRPMNGMSGASLFTSGGELYFTVAETTSKITTA